MYDFHVFTIFNTELTLLIDSSLLRFITNQHNDQLPVGLLIQLIEQCTGDAKITFMFKLMHYYKLTNKRK